VNMSVTTRESPLRPVHRTSTVSTLTPRVMSRLRIRSTSTPSDRRGGGAGSGRRPPRAAGEHRPAGGSCRGPSVRVAAQDPGGGWPWKRRSTHRMSLDPATSAGQPRTHCGPLLWFSMRAAHSLGAGREPYQTTSTEVLDSEQA
jgi:hypothetical protein